MSKQRQTRSGCPISNALDVIGDKWSLLIIRDVMFFDRHEFKEMRDADEGIATNILADRLKKLSDLDVLNSIPHPTNGKKKLYYLTGKGKSLLPLMSELVLWGDGHCPGSNAPPEKIAPMRRDRKKYMAGVLAGIEKWELEYLAEQEQL